VLAPVVDSALLAIARSTSGSARPPGARSAFRIPPTRCACGRRRVAERIDQHQRAPARSVTVLALTTHGRGVVGGVGGVEL